MKFPEKLESLLNQRGMTQAQLARETGLAQSAVHDMIKGRRRPYLDQGLSIAAALGVSLDYLANDNLTEPIHAQGPKSDEEYMFEQMKAVFAHSGYSMSDILKFLSVDSKVYVIQGKRFSMQNVRDMQIIRDDNPSLEITLMNSEQLKLPAKQAIALLMNLLGYIA